MRTLKDANWQEAQDLAAQHVYIGALGNNGWWYDGDDDDKIPSLDLGFLEIKSVRSQHLEHTFPFVALCWAGSLKPHMSIEHWNEAKSKWDEL